LQTTFVTEVQLTQTASFLQNQINQKVFTSSFNAYTQSAATDLNNLSSSIATTINNLSSSTALVDAAQEARINGLASFTGSYATTGSNNFIGNQTITGSLILSSSVSTELTVIGNSIFSGSVRGQVVNLSITSNTASMDLSLANFFTITLNASSACRIEPTNIQPGQTITLRVTQPGGGGGTVQFPSNVDFPNGFQYNATPSGNAVDILTFLSFDSASLYYSRANQFV
jgi:hypothetical protein